MQYINASSIVNAVVSVPASNAAEFEIGDYVTPNKTLLLMPESGADLHVLFTKADDTTDADADDFPVPSTGLCVQASRRIGRISIYNTDNSNAKKLYIATAQ